MCSRAEKYSSPGAAGTPPPAAGCPQGACGIPRFPGAARKNDALFLYGCTQPLPWVHCYTQTATEVVHGPACRPPEEIDLAQCRADAVPVHLRRGGGGTVVLSPGMVIVVVVGARVPSGSIPGIYERVHRPIGDLLYACAGLRLMHEGISDLALEGRKVCGSSLYLCRTPALFCYQSSLMVDNDLSLIDRYLLHPPREPAYRAGRAHAQFCTSLRSGGAALTARMVASLLETGLAPRIEPPAR